MPTSSFEEACDCGAAMPATAARLTTARTRAFLNTNRLLRQGIQDSAQAVLERHFGLPRQNLARSGDVGLADLGIVDGERFENDLARRAAHAEDDPRELEQRVLAGVAEVHRQMLLARREEIQAANEVVDVAE